MEFKALGGFSLSGGIENTTADCFRDFLWWQCALANQMMNENDAMPVRPLELE
jgi:hypothetical protein